MKDRDQIQLEQGMRCILARGERKRGQGDTGRWKGRE